MTDLTADAIILRTSEVTRVVDGVLMRRVFFDDFDRSVAQGLGGEWTFDPYDSYPAYSPETAIAYVDGTEKCMVLISPDTGSSIYESYAGFPVPANGELLFDFYTGSSSLWANGRPTYGFTLTRWDYSGIYISPTSTAGQWKLETWTSNDPTYLFNPDQNSWYRARLRWTSAGIMARVWKVGTTEPDVWHSEMPDTYDWSSGRNTPPFLDMYYSFVGPTEKMKLTNVEFWSMEPSWPVYKNMSLGAEVSVPWTLVTATADAIISRTITKTGTPTDGRDVQFVGAAKASAWSAVSSVSVTKPTGVQSGDRMVMSVISDSASNSRPTCSGWSERYSVQEADGSWKQIFTKTAGGSEPSSYSVAVAVATGLNAVLTAWRGTPTGNPTIQYLGKNTSPYDQITSPVVAGAAPGFLVEVFLSSSFGPGSMTTPSGMTEAIQSTDYYIQQAVFYDRHVVGDVGGDSLTISNPDAGSPVRGSFLIFWTDGGTGFTLGSTLVDTSIKIKLDAEIAAANTFRPNAVIKRTQDSYRTQILSEGPSGYWEFEDTKLNGVWVLDETHNGHDGYITMSYYQYEGTYSNWPGWFTRGVSVFPNGRKGWNFSPTSYAPPIIFNGYFQTAGSACSIEAWIKVPASVTNERWLWTAGDGLRLMISGGKLVLRSEKGYVYVITDATYNDDVLHHVVGVWEGTPGVQMLSNQLKIYVDGVSVAVTGYETPWWSDAWTAPYPGGTTSCYIGDTVGSGSPGWDNAWKGYLDAVAHYNGVALSPATIAYHNWLGRQTLVNPGVFMDVVVHRPGTSPFAKYDRTIDAYIVSPYRTLHDRGNGPHYDDDLDTIIVLARQIGVYAEGSTLHDLLVGIHARMDTIEGISTTPPPPRPVGVLSYLVAGAVIHADMPSSVSANAIIQRASSSSATADSVQLREATGNAYADAVIV
jgi:hypothetical protein